MALARYEHQGAAAPTTLASGINNSVTTFAVAAGGGSGYPTGIVGDFIMCIDENTPSEEKMLCSGRASDAFTVVTRGIDGTAAAEHSSGAVVTHVFGAIEADDDNDHVYTTTRDDHTQYARTDGTRAVTGAQTFNQGATVDNGLTVAGGATIGGGLAVTGTAAVTGNETVSGTLGVTGVISGASTVAGTALIASLTGTSGRFVGVTDSAPTSGTFLTGDFAIDVVNGCIWICIAGGTSGQWVASGAQARSAVVTPDGGGTISVNYPTSFATATDSVVATAGDTAGGLGFVVVEYSTVSTSGFSAKCYTAAGTVLTSGPVRVNWFAKGH